MSKKILIFALISLFIVLGVYGVGEARTRSDNGLLKGLGNGATLEQNGGTRDVPLRTFRIVRFMYHSAIDASTPLGSGQGLGDYRLSNDSLVIWDTSVSGDDGITVTTSGVTGDSRIAGVMIYGVDWISTDANNVIVSQDSGSTNWGYLQTRGMGWVLAGGPITSGDAVTASGIHGRAARFGSATTGLESAKSGYWTTVSKDAQYKGNAGFAMDDIAVGARGKVFLKCD